MKQLLLIFVALPLMAQSPSGLLNTNRYPAPGWTAAGAGTIPARTTICTSLTSSATPSAVASAITSCPSGETVSLGAGTYNWSTSLIISAQTLNVTLRGAGPKSTILKFSGTSTNCLGIGPTAICPYNGDSNALGGTSNFCAWTAGYSAGTTVLTAGTCSAGSLSNLHVGSLLMLSQNDDSTDTGNALFNGTTTYSQQGDGGNVIPGQSQTQLVSVTNISGTSITISPAIYAPQWSSGKSPQMSFSSSLPLNGFGLENLTVDTSSVPSSSQNAAMIQFVWATNSWVKNVSMINSTSGAFHKHVWVADSSHITVRDSYMYGADPSSEGYGVDFWESADNLAENNICQHMPTCEIMEGGAGNVFGYNYAVDNYYNNGDPQWQQCDQFHHNAGDYYNLWEGNIGICHTEDSIHGTAFANTVFRNALSGFDPSTSTTKTQNNLTFNTMGYARYANYVDNVLGYGGHATSYQYNMASTTDCGIGNSGMVFLWGDTGQIGSEYSSTCYGGTLSPPGPVPNDIVSNAGPAFSSMVCGNWDAVTAGIHTCATASSASTYPGLSSPSTSYASYPSFYRSGTPAWWNFPSGLLAPYPGIGSEVTGGNISGTSGTAYLNPAANNYLNNLGGLTNGSTGSLQSSFDGSVYYSGAGTVNLTVATAGSGTGTITGSNCANGNYASATSVTCTATATGGSTLSSVAGTGSASGCTSSPCTFSLTTPSTYTATFTGGTATCGNPYQNGPNYSGSYAVPPTILPLSVGFTSPTTGCAMHATFDGSAPTCSSASYSGSSSLSSSTVIRVIACQTAYTSSSIIGGTWTFTGLAPPPISIIVLGD